MRGKRKKKKEKVWKCFSRSAILHTHRCPDCGELLPKYGECKRKKCNQ